MDAQEQEELELLKEWWQNNGVAVLLGLFVGISGVLGWRLHEAHLEEQAESASDIFQELAEAAREQDIEQVDSLAESIREEYTDSIYGHFINLTRSRLAVTDNDLAEAQAELLDFIDSSPAPLLLDLARIRLARILIAGRELAAAEETLAKVETESSAVLELLGDLHLLQARPDEAAESYRNSYLMSQQEQDNNPVLPTSPWLSLKLESLGINPDEISES